MVEEICKRVVVSFPAFELYLSYNIVVMNVTTYRNSFASDFFAFPKIELNDVTIRF